MLTYILRRIAIAVPLLLAVALTTFLLLYALPGDAVDALLGTKYTEAAAQRIRQQEGLDDPIFVQFSRYVSDLLHGDLGENQKKTPVITELKTRLPATIELTTAAMGLAVMVGVSMGILSALRPRGWRDMAVLTISLAGVSIPIFWLALLVQRLCRRGGVLAEWFGFAGMPLGGRLSEPMLAAIDQRTLAGEVMGRPIGATGFYLYDAVFVFHDSTMLFDALAHLALPAIVLSTVPTAIIMRITRTAVGEQLTEDYIRTARAKGVRSGRVVWRHALRNAAIPIVTAVGAQVGYLLGGAVLTETIFAWPGMGTYIVDAINKQDIRPLQAGVLIIAGGFVVINLLVDLSYALLDPRVRSSGDGA